MNAFLALATGLVLTGTLVACGDQAGSTAQDSSAAQSETVSQTPSPTATPTTGSYPAYPHEDYDYTLTISCYCPSAGDPVRIEVRDGEVASAVYVTKTVEHNAGEAVSFEWQRKTLQEVIDAANDTEADRVKVTWPAGQDYPTHVYVDQMRHAVDEEVAYRVTRVVPLD
jgi:hypothetical protein